jgi:hypothetical protein
MRNLAGTGRAGWQLLGVDEEYGTPVMALDMTGGQVNILNTTGHYTSLTRRPLVDGPGHDRRPSDARSH